MQNLDELRDDVAACQAAIDQAVQHFHNNIHVFTEEQAEVIRTNLAERQARLHIAKMYLDELKS